MKSKKELKERYLEIAKIAPEDQTEDRAAEMEAIEKELGMWLDIQEPNKQ